jgi:hypothetical protein
MRIGRTAAAALLSAALVLGGCGDDDGDDGAGSGDAAEDVVLAVDLTGDEEVPGPGAGSGSGRAEVTVAPGGAEVCFSLEVDGLEGVSAAHVHEGRPGTAGPIAVTLEAPVEGTADGCADSTTSIVDGLVSGDRSFYVNVHTDDFPDGAVRGQLTE